MYVKLGTRTSCQDSSNDHNLFAILKCVVAVEVVGTLGGTSVNFRHAPNQSTRVLNGEGVVRSCF